MVPCSTAEATSSHRSLRLRRAASVGASTEALAPPLPNGSRRAVEHSTRNLTVVTALQDFSSRVLALAEGAEAILEVAQRFPAEGSLRLAASFFWLFAQTPDAQAEAARHIAAARATAAILNGRELAWLGALETWHAKSFDSAATAFEDITKSWPDDLLALRAAEFLYYVLGQQYSGPRFLAHTARLAQRHGEDPDFLAMHAFANELCGRLDVARSHAEHALGLRARNPWAQHALAHVMLWEGDSDSAAVLMDGWLEQWPHVARTAHCHNAWHLALMHLDRMESARAFEVFDAHVWAKTPDYVVEQLDSIAFLWRAEMANVPVEPARWEALVAHVHPVCATLFMPFATAHYIYALARAGDIASVQMLVGIADDRAACDDAEAVRVWRTGGRGIVRAAAALGSGNAREAADAFAPAMPYMTRIGGSDAQDDLFRFAYIDSLRRCGRRADAAAYLNERLSRKPASPLEHRLLMALSGST